MQLSTHKRARTQEQKSFRREQILEAAERHFNDVGYEAFSMANLAKTAGVVKGTLYLYFKTREEVFLTLYNRSLVRWSQAFCNQLSQLKLSQLSANMMDHAYSEALYTTAMADESFIALLTRLDHVIEHNVSIDSLIVSKRLFIEQSDIIATKTTPILKLSKAQALEALKTLGVLLVGATAIDQGPTLNGEDIPPDVQQFIDSFSSHSLFIKNACRIIRGIRAEDD